MIEYHLSFGVEMELFVVRTEEKTELQIAQILEDNSILGIDEGAERDMSNLNQELIDNGLALEDTGPSWKFVFDGSLFFSVKEAEPMMEALGGRAHPQTSPDDGYRSKLTEEELLDTERYWYISQTNNLVTTGAAEMVTRPYAFHQQEQFRDDLDLALSKILNVSGRVGCFTNRSCGVHVHVGLPLKDHVFESHTFQPFRRLAVITTVFESCLADIVNRESGYCIPLGERFRKNMSAVAIYNYIMSAQSIADLQKVMLAVEIPQPERVPMDIINRINYDRFNGGVFRYAKVNYGPLLRQAEYDDRHPSLFKAYGTVEFRVHPGTTNANEIEMWQKFLVALVRKCCQIDDTELFMIIKDYCGPDGLGTLEFLNLFVHDPEVVSWYLWAEERVL